MKTIIGIVSDLHLNKFAKINSRFPEMIMEHIMRQCSRAGANLLLNAGDTHHGNDIFAVQEFFASRIKYYDVYGNHDYEGKAGPTFQPLTPVVVNDLADGMRLYRHTLWSDLNRGDPVTVEAVRNFTPDFQEIPDMTPSMMMAANNYANTEFRTLLGERIHARSDIMLTHFGTNLKAIHPKYAGNIVNPYFVNDMSDWIAYTQKISLSISGHTHSPYDFIDNGVRYINNALGYPGENYKNLDEFFVKFVEYR